MFRVFIVIFILFNLLHFFNKNNEGFEADQIIDPKYISKLNTKDLRARSLTGDETSINTYYHSLIRKPSKKELELILNIFRVITTDIGDKYKSILDIPFKIYLFKKLENNFPHTHHNSILLPETFSLNYSYIVKNTLLHEKLHIIQRFKRENFYNLYEKYWKFSYQKIQDLERIEEYSRTNPDGLDNNWVFTNQGVKIVLMSLYDKDYKNISHTTTYGIYLDKESKLIFPIKKKEIKDIREFTDFFGKLNGNNYHPNELSADMIAHMLLGKKTDSPAFNKLTQWWNKL
tara:strand:+ start:2332 stop:3195 length:864 start_codon:yes stop_codon:yes gene_type:complete